MTTVSGSSFKSFHSFILGYRFQINTETFCANPISVSRGNHKAERQILLPNEAMNDAPPVPPPSADQLPPEALALAQRFFDAARNGQMHIFEQALARGLKPNMTNAKGDSLVCVMLVLVVSRSIGSC